MKRTAHEARFIFNINDIIDIKIKRETGQGKELNEETLFLKSELEMQRQMTRCFLRNTQLNTVEVCEIETYESSQFAKHIVHHWHDNIVRKSAGLKAISSTADAALAEKYYNETMNSLEEAKDDPDELREILEEFSSEVLLDLELKDVVFRSRQLLATLLVICRRVLSSPSKFKIGNFEKSGGQDYNMYLDMYYVCILCVCIHYKCIYNDDI